MSRKDDKKSKSGRTTDKERYQAYCSRVNKTPQLPGPSIYYPARDGVVTIYTSTFVGDGSGQHMYNTVGTGFFIDSKTIVTAAHNVFIPAFDGTGGTRANHSPPIDPKTGTSAPNAQRVERIRVTVNNVNYCHHGYTYDAELVGACLSLDIAVLRIPQVYGRLCAAPPISKHTVLVYEPCHGNSLIGEEVYIIGSSGNTEATGLARGMILDNLYSDNLLRSTGYGFSDRDRGNGFWAFESLMLDATVLPGNSGSPVLNSYGKIIGMIIGIDNASGFVARNEVNLDASNSPTSDTLPNLPGSSILSVANYSSRAIAVTSKIISRVVKAIVEYPNNECLNGHIQEITDSAGNFLRYKYGWLGIEGFEAYSPEHFYYVPDPEYRKQKGFIITEADSTSPFSALTTMYSNFENPQLGTPVAPTVNNDILLVTELQGVPVGVASEQYPLTTVTYATIEDMVLQVNYRLGSDKFKCGSRAFVSTMYYPLERDNIPRFTNTVSAHSRAIATRNVQQPVAERGLGSNMMKLLLNPHFRDAIKEMVSTFAGAAHIVAEGVADVIHAIKNDDEEEEVVAPVDEVAVSEKEQEVPEPEKEQEVPEPEKEQEVPEPEKEQEVPEPEKEQELPEPEKEQEVPEPEKEQEVTPLA
jgi:S1-C subfamily serine protease